MMFHLVYLFKKRSETYCKQAVKAFDIIISVTLKWDKLNN